MVVFETLHLMRPEFLWALLPLLVLFVLSWRIGGNNAAWHKLIDAELMPYLLKGGATKTGRLRYYLLGLSWLFACIALAGPSWQQLPTPVYEKDDVLVIILDNTPSMLAQDAKPSRATHAARKINDVLAQRNEGQTALITYSEDAFVVSPLTRDTNTIALLTQSLSPEIMPAIGNRPLEAFKLAIELIRNHPNARILWVSDEVPEADSSAIIKMVNRSNVRLSIMGIGTSSGAPIPIPNGKGFVKDSNGSLVVPRLNRQEFQRIAHASNGKYSDSLITDDDIDYLLDNTGIDTDAATEISEVKFDQWRDESWLIALLLLIPAALAFRQGGLLIMLISLGPILHSPSVQANWFDDLWQTKDQQAQQAFNQGDTKSAEALFNSAPWRGSAAYKNGNYEAAIEQYQQAQSANDWYNLGNAYAKSNNFEQAIKAYAQALQQKPDFEDAKANKKLLEELQKQQQEQGSQENGEPSDQQDQSGEQGDPQQGQQDEQQSSDSQQNSDQKDDGDAQDSKEQSSESEQQPSEQNSEGSDRDNNGSNDEAEPQTADENEASAESEQDAEANSGTQDDSEPRQALPAQLRNINDDPGGLLKRKFADQAQSRQQQRSSTGEQRW